MSLTNKTTKREALILFLEQKTRRVIITGCLTSYEEFQELVGPSFCLKNQYTLGIKLEIIPPPYYVVLHYRTIGTSSGISYPSFHTSPPLFLTRQNNSIRNTPDSNVALPPGMERVRSYCAPLVICDEILVQIT
ncbi:hypothetical protein CDAR_16541 [Caerostris darwini]|uniref:Uncharacterized protein n=1 Tax=Caerostris darwini TaxID=1538125 RepID=A0AAV4P820_9ARAC|nr:hypothetical protein CDAR_16541 [Caerostris darwini]